MLDENRQQLEFAIQPTVSRDAIDREIADMEEKAATDVKRISELLKSWRRRKVQFSVRTFGLDRKPVEFYMPNSKNLADLVGDNDPELRDSFAYAESRLDEIAHRPIWVVKGPSGKDSTDVLVLVTEYLRRRPWLKIKLITVQNDVLMELPPLQTALQAVVDHCHSVCEEAGIEHEHIITKPQMNDRYWVMTLGHGYPPFHRRFRPCTDSMKIKPSEAIMRQVIEAYGGTGEDMAVLLGIRTEESADRAARYDHVDKPTPNKDACLRGEGECGLVMSDGRVLSKTAPKGIAEAYPILRKRKCRVMDSLWFVFPELGWPTAAVADAYGDEDTRFGCWKCPLVIQVKDVQMMAQTPGNEWMDSLLQYRADYLYEAKLPNNRLHYEHTEDRTRQDGKIREAGVQMTGLTMAFRVRKLEELLAMDEKVKKAANGFSLIEPEEVEFIRLLWLRELATGKRGKRGLGKGAAS